MNLSKKLSSLLLLSAAFLVIGGTILRLEGLVPLTLTASTAAVVVLILVTAHFTWRGDFMWTTVGSVLAVVSIAFNASQPQHIQAVLNPFTSAPFLILVVSEIMGFFLLPAIYLILYAVNFKKLKR